MLLTPVNKQGRCCVMKYKLENGKEVNIPDEEIRNNMKILELTEEEAIEMWLDDNDYTENEEVEKLTKKAKENGIKIRGESDAPKAKRVVERKADPVKEDIIAKIAKCLQEEVNADRVKVTNVGKIIEFDLNGEHYKVDLIRQRAPKGGK